MKSAINPIVALTAVVLATTTALPAVAASPDQSTSAAVATVQQQRAAQRPLHRSQQRSGYHAYAAQPGTANSSDASGHKTVRGWPCAYRDESSAYSAFPSWELCN
jgi:hypothetical protein